jgi:hypothetical protein
VIRDHPTAGTRIHSQANLKSAPVNAELVGCQAPFEAAVLAFFQKSALTVPKGDNKCCAQTTKPPISQLKTSQGMINFRKWIGNGCAILLSHPKDFTPV